MRTIRVKVKPNARTASITLAADGSFVAQVKAPPVDGKANAELIELLALHFGRRRSAFAIKSGGAGRSKWVTIADD